MSATRYAIGIDLGTTHSALAEVDPDLSEGEEIALEVVSIPQTVAPGQIDDRKLLASFVYLAEGAGLPEGSLALPWGTPRVAVGEVARSLGQKTSGRLVGSAKSWLAAEGVDRRAAILPEVPADGVARISPLDASVAYLTHLRHAWERAHEGESIGDHDVVITVPASFDPMARELTSEAASAAGLGHAVLLEEPQAAVYSWIQKSEGTWRDQVQPGEVILVVDLGGGTTDFSLIAVLEEAGALALRRIAVGDHILLGGDNMDLLLAHRAKTRLEESGAVIDPAQWTALVRAACDAKEVLLGSDAPESAPVTLLGRGSKLVGGALRTDLSRADVEELIVEGFFPKVPVSAAPEKRARAGLTRLGLPYASDAGVTRHLAQFLSRQKDAASDLAVVADRPRTFVHPTAVLFNGGVLKSAVIRDRLLGTLNGWLNDDGGAPVKLLGGEDLDLAVARGAAYYAFSRRGSGVRIRGGTAKSFYVGVESAMPAIPGIEPPVSALCIAPFGMEEGTDAPPAPVELGLVVGEPVHFRFFSSSVRRDDQPGALIERWQGQLEELAPIRATLPSGDRKEGDVVPVRLSARVSEVGVLELSARSRSEGSRSEERWKVELSTR
jgi:hypothetical protein